MALNCLNLKIYLEAIFDKAIFVFKI